MEDKDTDSRPPWWFAPLLWGGIGGTSALAALAFAAVSE